MTNASLALNLNQSLDVEGYLTTQITFDRQVVLEVITQLRSFFFGQVLNAGIGVDTGYGQNVFCSLLTNTVDVGQADLYPFLSGQVNTSNTCHTSVAPPLSIRH